MSQDAFADSHFQSLVIENFTVFEHAEFEFSPGVNIFIGENGCGKTHLLKVIYQICAYGASVNAIAKQQTGGIPAMFTGVASGFRLLFLSESLDELNRVPQIGDSPNENQIHFSGHCRDNEFNADVYADELVTHYSNFNVGEINRVTMVPATDMTSHTKGFLSIYSNYKIDFDETYNGIVGRLLSPEKRELNGQSVTLIERLQELIKGKLALEGERFYVTQGEKKIAMPMIAEGHRKIATLIRLIQTGWLEPGSVLIWDEPEVNLNPKLMDELVEALLILAESGVQIFLATHSYVILKEFDLQSQEKSVPIKYFALEPTSTGTKVHPSDTLDDLEPNAILEQYGSLVDRQFQRSLNETQSRK